jgi:amino acid transporter
LVLILYTYGGWNDAAFVAAEVKDGKKNITMALALGILLITILYLLVNYAYVNALGYRGAQSRSQIAADVLNRGFGKGGVALMCVLVMVSALGAVNGLIFTGARVYAKIGQDYRVLSWMGGWSVGNGAPVPALLTQGVLAARLSFPGWHQAWPRQYQFLVRTNSDHNRREEGQGRRRSGHRDEKRIRLFSQADGVGRLMEGRSGYGGREKATDLAKGGFDTLLTCTGRFFGLLPTHWCFVIRAARERDTHLERPFKVPFYPTLPLIFCVTCGYMLYSSIAYALVRD